MDLIKAVKYYDNYLEYFKSPGISNSDFKQIEINMKVFEYYKTSRSLEMESEVKKDARITDKIIGTIFHHMILMSYFKGNAFNFVTTNMNKRTKDYKEWKQDVDNNKYIIDENIFNNMKIMMKNLAVSETEEIRSYFQRAINNPDKFIFEGCLRAKINGIEVKALVDSIDLENKIVYDLKTISEITIDNITKSINLYKYYRQRWLTLIIIKEITGEDFQFKNIFVSKSAPFLNILVNYDSEWDDIAESEFIDLFAYYSANKNKKVGFDSEIVISPPQWLANKVLE